jgi:hypothetical protein
MSRARTPITSDAAATRRGESDDQRPAKAEAVGDSTVVVPTLVLLQG